MTAAAVIEREVACVSDIESIWTIVTDTERLNRAAGMGPLVLRPIDAGAARFLARTRAGGFEIEFEERPFEWRAPERFCVLRKMRSGPLRELSMGFELRGPGPGCRVTIRLELTPRWGLLGPIVRLSGKKTVQRLADAIAQADTRLASATAGGAALPPAMPRPRVDEAGLRRAVEALATAAPGPLVERLADLVRHGPDPDLSRLRPYELAEHWGLDRHEVLEGFLHGVQAGLFELSWDTICPSCRTASARCPSLAELSTHGSCQLCDLSFSIDLDRAVEATFSPNPAIRPIDAGPYCIGGPARTPHVVAQVLLAGRASASLPVPAKPGRYRIFVRGGAAGLVEATADGPDEATVNATDVLVPSRTEVKAGGTIRVANESDEERHAKLEYAEWPNLAATAHDVSLLGPFRRLFSGEVLRAGLALRVARVALVFTDLSASTALYSRAGDAAAFAIVQDHFEVLARAIEHEGGTIVKTIGDAVMAAFRDEESALRACSAMLDAFERFRSGRAHCEDIRLRIGAHAGACYLVTANGILDYFGQTVNLAARLQGLAADGELVLGDTPGRAPPEGFTVEERFEATLKGIVGPTAALRLRLRLGG